MKTKSIFLVIGVLFYCSTISAQQWNWHGNSSNETVSDYAWGVIQKMKTSYGCSAYNYGKSTYQVVDVYSYSEDNHRIRFNIKFSWQIDFMFMPSQEYSYTLSVSTTSSGCNTKVSYDGDTGEPICANSKGNMYDLGCVA